MPGYVGIRIYFTRDGLYTAAVHACYDIDTPARRLKKFTDIKSDGEIVSGFVDRKFSVMPMLRCRGEAQRSGTAH